VDHCRRFCNFKTRKVSSEQQRSIETLQHDHSQGERNEHVGINNPVQGLMMEVGHQCERCQEVYEEAWRKEREGQRLGEVNLPDLPFIGTSKNAVRLHYTRNHQGYRANSAEVHYQFAHGFRRARVSALVVVVVVVVVVFQDPSIPLGFPS